MHIVVSWDITDGAPPRSELSESLKEAFAGHSWFRPLTTYYVIKADEAARLEIYEALLTVAEANPDRINFVVSPVMQGAYLGFLPQTSWDKINKRTL
ncbi:hypothetical protein [Devosia sp. Root635]|uniref:hypothetical protein n=1 Tax=Devosia sp. Root635 TaxID=1736575 RepID=UPI0006FEA46F|nr:hypothetical protein [Devosia sp. Root635]KRA42108.1 hypothetical protein ASD80_10305 [Devosia sp. Root635]